MKKRMCIILVILIGILSSCTSRILNRIDWKQQIENNMLSGVFLKYIRDYDLKELIQPTKYTIQQIDDTHYAISGTVYFKNNRGLRYSAEWSRVAVIDLEYAQELIDTEGLKARDDFGAAIIFEKNNYGQPKPY